MKDKENVPREATGRRPDESPCGDSCIGCPDIDECFPAILADEDEDWDNEYNPA